MSDTPQTRSFRQPPLAVYVETAPASDEWVLDPRCAVEEIKRVAGGQAFSTATIRVYPGPIDSASAGLRAGLEGNWTEAALAPGSTLWASAREGTPFTEFIGPDQAIMIARDWPDHREVLFAGYCEQPRYDQQQSGARVREGFVLTVEDTWKRINLLAEGQILGRRMYRPEPAAQLSAMLDAEVLPETFGFADVQRVESFPCVFNPGGKGNCAPVPIEIAVENGPAVLVHVFTHERDPHAVSWTYAMALRYLAVFHYLNLADGSNLDNLLWFRRDGLTPESWPAPAGVLAATDYEHEGVPLIELDHSDRPPAPASREDALAFALLGTPRALDVDGLVIGEALNLLCEQAGMRFALRAEADEESVDARPLVRMVVWARGAGRPATFSRTGPSLGVSTQELLDANNVSALALQQDWTNVYPNPDVFGDVERFEFTAELVPGWLPDAHLDDVADIATELDYADLHTDLSVEDGLYDDPWYKRYHKNGSEFAQHRRAGRRWVLNEDARYPAEKLDAMGEPLSPSVRIWAREAAPFNDAAYAPWTPKQCNLHRAVLDPEGHVQRVAVRDPEDAEPAESWEIEAGAPWSVRPRPLHDCLSADADGNSLGIVVEVCALSENLATRADELAGDHDALTWVRLTGVGILTLAPHATIYIDAEDLTALTPWSADDTIVDSVYAEPLSVWAALVEQRMLLRVTGVVEGDQRCRPRLDVDPLKATRMFDLAEQYHQNRNDLANSTFASYPEGIDPPAGNRPAPGVTQDADDDDDLLALQKAAELIQLVSIARVQPGAITVPWVTEQFAIGDTVSAITGTGVVFTSYGDEGAQRFPDIVAVVTTPRDTTFHLEDERFLEEQEEKKRGVFAKAEVKDRRDVET